MTQRALLAGMLVLLSSAAFGASNVIDLSPVSGVGSSAVVVWAGAGNNGIPQSLSISNAAASGGNSLSCGYKSTIALNGQGTFSIPAQATAFWPSPTAPNQAIWCVATSSTPIGVFAGY